MRAAIRVPAGGARALRASGLDAKGGAAIARRGLDLGGHSAASWATGRGADLVGLNSCAPPLVEGRERVEPIGLAALVRSANILDVVELRLALDRLLRLVLDVFERVVLAPDCGVDELDPGRDEMSRKRSRSSSRRLRSVDGGGCGLEGVPRTKRRGRFGAGLSPVNEEEPIGGGLCVGAGSGIGSTV